METDQLIGKLKASNLYAECSCGEEFKLSDAVLFDGTKSFPEEALEIQSQLDDELEKRNAELKKKKKLAQKEPRSHPKPLISEKTLNEHCQRLETSNG